MKAKATWVDGVAWMAEADSGHGLVVDGSPDIGGRNLGPRPMELVLQGLATCSGMDVISMLRKGRASIEGFTISVEAERAPDPPKVFTRVHVEYTITGQGLRDRAVERAIDLSMEKYCSVTAMLASTATVTHSYTVERTDDPATAG